MTVDMTKQSLLSMNSMTQALLKTINNPPSTSQKDAMRRTWMSGQILLRVAHLLVVNHIERIHFNPKQIAAAAEHVTGLPSPRCSLEDFVTYVNIGNQLGIDNAHIVDALRWHGIPVHFNSPGDSIQFIRKGREGTQQLIANDHREAMLLLVEQDIVTQALFAVLYLTDLERLLSEKRERGQSLLRYLPIYANTKLNERLYHNFEAITNRIRFLMIDGLDLDELTYDILMRVIDEIRVSGQASVEPKGAGE